jgi:hypothetical protein
MGQQASSAHAASTMLERDTASGAPANRFVRGDGIAFASMHPIEDLREASRGRRPPR